MSKTIKQIADEIGISKQKVYRYIKNNHIIEAHQNNGMMYYDETAETIIKQAFEENNQINEVNQNHINDTVNDTLIELLKTELEIKNKQIEELNSRLSEVTAVLTATQKSMQAEQLLHAGTQQKQLLVEPKRGFFGLFRKGKE